MPKILTLQIVCHSPDDVRLNINDNGCHQRMAFDNLYDTYACILTNLSRTQVFAHEGDVK